MADYAEIVSKLTLLFNAGLTIHSSLNRIQHDFLASNSREYHYAYDEIKLTLELISNGHSESVAYGDFGKRIGLSPYIKLGALLEQNLKKGSSELKYLLSQEVLQASEQRRRSLTESGEKANTKLLLPMMLIFMMILMVIMIPAFLNMSI